ncbi:MAG: bifunctional DNA-formamidopyrimidine glycosylase/DNA-(apurinic or apyrimidinic site) lyase [Anaerolineae bacterium]|nr:bifunctional DNA-formamidopyrimidine glycosylase/DNA-(apurinic or apyrimidinic site) lyase [Anaerolineae bacterium]
MPELPEVETVARTLRPMLTGAAIAAVEVLDPLVVRPPGPAALASGLEGRRIVGIGRRGKHLILALDDASHLVVHLGMTGQLLLSQGDVPPPRFARVKFTLQDGRALWYADMRKFGRLGLVRDVTADLASLGPEPFAPELDAEALLARLAGRRRPIKSLLLDQSFLAGLGNIYADEALFEAGIHPCTPARNLTLAEAERLLQSLRGVLARGIANRGTTIADYVDGQGRPGTNQWQLRVYGRAGQDCPRCGRPIERLRLAGRSTCFCSSCQPSRPKV